ncbi:PAS domain-containing protein [Halorientalis pallida]|uniref:PAS domain-containing protein n=1 Tax=Halorientalis pallida TaxID=2479928 RepID=UPI003C6F67C9
MAVGSVLLAGTGGAWLRTLAGIAGGDGVVPVLVVGLAVDHDADGVIDRLIEQVRRLEDGDYDIDVPTDRGDGLGELATELDALAAMLAAADDPDVSTGGETPAPPRGGSRFEAVFEDPGMLVGLLDPDGTHRRSNETAMSYIDAGPDDVAGVPFWETPWWAGHEDAQAMIKEKVERAATGEYVSYEADLTDAAGERFSREGTIRPVTEDGEVVSLVVSARDVTDRKERERDLERYRGLVNAMRDSACIYDADGQFEVVNQAIANFYRTTPEDLEGTQSHLVEHVRESGADGTDPYQELVDGHREEIRGEYESTYPEAGHAVVEYRMTRLTVDGEFGGIVGVARDVTERRDRERQFRAIVENTINPIYIKDREGNYQFANEASAEFFGLDRDELVGKTDHDLFDDESAASIREDDRTILETGESIVVERTRRIDGEKSVFLDNKYPFRDENGEIVGIIGISRDITERTEKERELERYKEFTDDILDAIDDVFYALDRDGNLTRWNESLPAVTGYDDAEIASMHATDFFTEADRPDIEAAIDDVSETGRTRVEVDFLTKDGESIPHEFVATRVQTPDGDPAIAGIGRNVSERREREEQLRERERVLSTLIGNIPGMVYRCANEPDWPFEFVSEGCRAVTGYDPETIEDGDVVWGEDVIDDDNDEIWTTVQDAVENRDPFQLTYRIEDADGERRWLWEQGRGVFDDGGNLQALEGVIMDVTDQKRRELALQSLHDAARRLLGTETESDVTELVLDVATEVVDTPAVGIYLLDSETNTLEPTAFTDSFADLYDGPPAVTVGDADSLVWNTFVTETRTIVEDGEATDGTGLFDDGVRNGVLVPIGDHGVFVALSRDGGLDATTRQLVETLVATTEAALDRLDSEATLRERDAELKAQNERLRRQIQINEIIRSIDQSLIGSNTHEQIERAVCERLVTDDTISFAWIGALDPDGESVTARQWAGEGESYLDAIAADGTAATPEPAWQAARTESPVIVENVVDDLQREGWRKPALAHGFHSAVAVPLVFDEYSYGVLAVYATEPGAFGDLERSVFAELGESIANSITAAKTRQALHAETLLELELRFEDADDLLARIAREADCRVEYEGLASVPDDDDRVFFVAHETDPDAVRDVLGGLVSVTDTRLISDADGSLFEVTTAAPLVAAKLVSHGGRPQSITADHTGMDVVVDLPTGTDVREFVEMLQEDHPSVELVARRHVERSTHTRRELVTTLFEALTDRQREVLETAYLAGFFEQPRETTGEELAAMLGVSQPTVNRHLRLAQQRLMEQLFSTESGDSQ